MNAIETVVGIKNAKLFPNDRDNVEVKIGKDLKIKAALSYFDSNVGYDIRVAPPQKAKESGREYIKVTMSVGKEQDRKYFNGLLNVVKKADSNYSFAGYLDVEGTRTVKVMVKKPAEGTAFHTVIFSKEKVKAEAGVEEPKVADTSGNQGDPF